MVWQCAVTVLAACKVHLCMAYMHAHICIWLPNVIKLATSLVCNYVDNPPDLTFPPSSRPRLLSHLVTFPTLPVHTNWPALFCNHRSLMMTPGLGSKHLFLDLCPQKRLAGVLSSEILHNLRYFQDSSNLISCANDN